VTENIQSKDSKNCEYLNLSSSMESPSGFRGPRLKNPAERERKTQPSNGQSNCFNPFRYKTWLLEKKCKKSASHLNFSRWSLADPVLHAVEACDVVNDASQVLAVGGQILLGQVVEIVDNAGEIKVCPCELS
jgi:hypothetical protein